MILEVISEIQDPLEAPSQVTQEETDPVKNRRASFVRGPSTFNLRSSSTNLRAHIADSPPMRRTVTAAGVMQSPNGEVTHEDEWLTNSSSSKLDELRTVRLALAKKKDHYGVYRIAKVNIIRMLSFSSLSLLPLFWYSHDLGNCNA